MHEKILQGVTVGVVTGMLVYWLTSKKHADYAGKSGNPSSYKPLLGDVRTVRFGSPVCADCDCAYDGPLVAGTQNSPVPLAANYLECSPDYAAPTSKWNLGVSLQLSCEGIDLHSGITREETASAFPIGIAGPNTVPRPVRLTGPISCSPQVPITVDCTEVI